MEADEGAIMYSHPEAMFPVVSELRSGLAAEAEHARRLAAARRTRRARRGRRHSRPAATDRTALAELRTAQLEAAAVVASFDLDDTDLWRRVDRTVAGLAAASYRLTAAVTGRAAGATATRVPPVVRVRELAVAQGRLAGVLDRYPPPPAELVAHTHRLVRRHGAQLRSALREGVTPDPVRVGR
jgi:hypothetical protein